MALPGPSTLPSAPGEGSNPDSKSYAQTASRLLDNLRNYSNTATTPKHDVFMDRYRIELSTPLPEFDTKLAKAYAATDLIDPAKLIFALVCNPGTTPRMRVIQALKSVNHQYILPLLNAGPVELSRPEEERFVIFYERPAGKKLSELLAQHNQPINQHFLCDRIIAPLASALNMFTQLEISHGALRPDNIYFADIAVLGPCVAEPCGYSQTYPFETLERMQSLPTAKGEGTTSHDFYALAVLVLYILHGPEHFKPYNTQDRLISAILREGVYNALTRQLDVPEIFNDFFRGIFSQTADDRWDYRYVKPWLDGKRYNVLPPPTPNEAIRPYEFGELQASTRRELAHILFFDWDKIADQVQSGKLTQWVSVSLRNKELADSIARITRSASEASNKNDVQLSEQLMRILLLLDPQGPIRIKQMSLHLDGIDTLCADLHMSRNQSDLQFLAKFIEFNMANYWLEQQRKGRDYEVPAAINAILIRLERLRACIRNSGYGFGLERMIYDLNPELPCQSPIFKNWHVGTLSVLLKRLNQLAPSLAKDDDPLDRHIAAFIASKLSLQHEVRLHELAAVPSLANNRTMIALRFLSMAQQKTENAHLPGLTHWFALRLLPTLETIHSRTLRERMKNVLLEHAPAGYLQLMADTFINADYATTDQVGFNHAWATYHNNAIKIQNFRAGLQIDQQSARVGYSISKTLAYMGLMISLFTSIMGY